MNQDHKIEQQVELEEEMRGMGIARYLRKMTSSEEATLPPGLMMLRQSVSPLCQALTLWIKEVRSGKARKYAQIANAVELVGVEQAAYLAMRMAVNAVSARMKVTAFALSVGDALEEEGEFQAFKKSNPGLFKNISAMVKKSGSDQFRSRVMHLMRRRAGIDDLAWAKEDKLKIGTKLMELAIESTGLIELVTVSEGRHSSVHYVMGTQAARDWVAKQHEYCQLLSPLYLPMVCKPNDWTSPFHGGYFTQRNNLIKTPNKNYLEELAHTEMPAVYHAVNALQATSWRINKRIHQVMSDVWHLGGDRAGLPQKDPRQVPDKPLDIDTNEESLSVWKRKAKLVHLFNHRNMSKVVGSAQKLWVAEKFKDEESIHFVWTLDWRGRAYPMGTFVHPQGDDSGKALLEFSEGKPLGENGANWLAVQLANTYGNDKVSYEDRIEWAHEHSKDIWGYATDPLVNTGWMEADSPFCFLAACFEWQGFLASGNSHICNLSIQVDGSCNGLQNFSALLLDPVGGGATNLIPSDTPSDIYGRVASTASTYMAADAAAGIPEALVMLGKYGRKWTKRNCMTYAYSVTQYGMKDQLLEEIRKVKDTANEVDMKGCDEFKVASYLAGLNLRAIGNTVVAAKEAMEWLQEVAKVAASDSLPVWWTSPSGLPVQQSYMNTLGQTVKVYFGGKRTEFTIRVDGRSLNSRRQEAGIAPNVIHSFDAAHMAGTLKKCTDAGMTDFSFIHDSYGTHACDMDGLSDALRSAFVEQYSDDLLMKFRDEIADQLTRSGSAHLVEKLPPLPMRGTLDLEAVNDSRYFFA